MATEVDEGGDQMSKSLSVRARLHAYVCVHTRVFACMCAPLGGQPPVCVCVCVPVRLVDCEVCCMGLNLKASKLDTQTAEYTSFRAGCRLFIADTLRLLS